LYMFHMVLMNDDDDVKLGVVVVESLTS
jgi:hypothetical protein